METKKRSGEEEDLGFASVSKTPVGSITFATTPGSSFDSSSLTSRALSYGGGDAPIASPEADGVSPKSTESEALMDVEAVLQVKAVDVFDGDAITVWVDPSLELGLEFLKTVCKRSFCCIVQRGCKGDRSFGRTDGNSYGQMGLLVCLDGKRRPVTAMHCFKPKEIKVKGTMRTYTARRVVTMYSALKPDTLQFKFSADQNFLPGTCTPAPLRQSETWKHGIDIAWGSDITNNADFNKFLPSFGDEDFEMGDVHFSMVRDDFKVKHGMKVGIVVFNKYQVTRSSSAFTKSSYKDSTNISDEKLKALYGPANAIAIYCGAVSYVGNDFIEYTLNSTKGNSGAMVILLEVKDQHPEVLEDDIGKVIACHAGFHPNLGTNIGFKLTSKPYPTQQEDGTDDDSTDISLEDSAFIGGSARLNAPVPVAEMMAAYRGLKEIENDTGADAERLRATLRSRFGPES